LVLLIIESTTIGVLYWRLTPTSTPSTANQLYPAAPETFTVPFYKFNSPISNDTEYSLTEAYNNSWTVTLQNQLTFSGSTQTSEAEVAFAPEYPAENQSIPTIIVQMRADGLVRVEYFAQSWPKSFGLVLYNSTSPTWVGGQNITLRFISFGPPSPVNPQLAPRPNGNLTITIGQTRVLADFPIAWANISSFYVYGLPNSTFTTGQVLITAYRLMPSL